jgi:hypothetical protein
VRDYFAEFHHAEDVLAAEASKVLDGVAYKTVLRGEIDLNQIFVGLPAMEFSRA